MSNIGSQIFTAITLKPTSELHIIPINIDILVFYFSKSKFKIILLSQYCSPHLSFFPVFHIPESFVIL